MLRQNYTRFDEMYSKRRSISKIDRSKLRRSVPVMDYNVMAKGKKKLLKKRKSDIKFNVTNNLKRRKFEGSNIQKIKKMVLLASNKDVRNTTSTTTTKSGDGKIRNYIETSPKQFLHKQKYKHFFKINNKYPLMCSESLPENSSVHTRSMTRQHSFIGSVYNKVLYKEELKICGHRTHRDSTEFPLWPEGDKTVSNVMLDSLNHVLQFCSTYQKPSGIKRKIIITPMQSQNKMAKNYFTSQREYKQPYRLKVNDQRNIPEWQIDENGLEYKTIKLSLPSDRDKLSSDDDVFVKPQDPSHYKALNKHYIKTVKKCKDKDACKTSEKSVIQNSELLNNYDSKAKNRDSTIIIIDDDDSDDKGTEINDCDVSKSLYNMVMNTSLLYCMLCGVPVTETTKYINNFRSVHL